MSQKRVSGQLLWTQGGARICSWFREHLDKIPSSAVDRVAIQYISCYSEFIISIIVILIGTKLSGIARAIWENVLVTQFVEKIEK